MKYEKAFNYYESQSTEERSKMQAAFGNEGISNRETKFYQWLTKQMKQAERKARLLPNGKPRYIRCYDNEGRSADRYTVVFTGRYTQNTGGEHVYLGMSANPYHPMGIGMHGSNQTQIDTPAYSHLGKKVTFESLPEPVQRCTTETYLDLWGFLDGKGDLVLPDPDKWY